VSRKSVGLWDIIIELFGDKIVILFLSVFVATLGIIAWILRFIPGEYQGKAFLMICISLGGLLALASWLIKGSPATIRGFLLRRY
jgi:hypothetical protein